MSPTDQAEIERLAEEYASTLVHSGHGMHRSSKLSFLAGYTQSAEKCREEISQLCQKVAWVQQNYDLALEKVQVLETSSVRESGNAESAKRYDRVISAEHFTRVLLELNRALNNRLAVAENYIKGIEIQWDEHIACSYEKKAERLEARLAVAREALEEIMDHAKGINYSIYEIARKALERMG